MAKPMVGKAVVVSSVIALALLGAGVFLLMNSLTPLERENIVLNDTFNVLGNKYENRTALLKNDVDYRVFFTVSDSTIKFYPMSEDEFSIWQQGQFEPRWVESDQYYARIGGTGNPAGGATFYFVFFNNNTSIREVHLEVSNAWQETNYIGLFGGAALILSGCIIGIIAKYRLTRV
jgi:hypothetical protein